MPIDFKPYERPVLPGAPADRAREFTDRMAKRRSVRHFSQRGVPQELIEELIRTAGTAPSGANKQPWRFVAVNDPSIKREIRLAAEEEERQFYERRANPKWLDDLRHLGTDAHKPFLEDAPWLIVVFRVMKDEDPDERIGASDQVYYVAESVGISVGLLLAAAQNAGLATLTHTPSPMKFLSRILKRPNHERPFLLIPIGYPTADCLVPDISRKPLSEIMVLNEGVDSNENQSTSDGSP
ncbi:MAG: nitroreductase family protein [Planctomycetota bacterium]|nr:nitroreductase family protein [Planctomycetota bacterium]